MLLKAPAGCHSRSDPCIQNQVELPLGTPGASWSAEQLPECSVGQAWRRSGVWGEKKSRNYTNWETDEKWEKQQPDGSMSLGLCLTQPRTELLNWRGKGLGHLVYLQEHGEWRGDVFANILICLSLHFLFRIHSSLPSVLVLEFQRLSQISVMFIIRRVEAGLSNNTGCFRCHHKQCMKSYVLYSHQVTLSLFLQLYWNSALLHKQKVVIIQLCCNKDFISHLLPDACAAYCLCTTATSQVRANSVVSLCLAMLTPGSFCHCSEGLLTPKKMDSAHTVSGCPQENRTEQAVPCIADLLQTQRDGTGGFSQPTCFSLSSVSRIKKWHQLYTM